nr:hypothetical protein [Lachnospiraceae bacterium]
LTEKGYKIMKGDDGKPANLNDGSGSKSALSDSPSEVYVYLGYKTTTDPNDAITDLAVMNMKGGYSFSDYEKLLENNMETKIKPFVKEFIATIKEYRENYNKPEKTINHKRANMIRVLLNFFTDDDTGDKPIGDLLLNKTKYELGDEAYEKLSDSDKKKHADIVTIIMQGSVSGVYLIEKMLVKAADCSDDTWIQRLEKIDPDEFEEDFEEEYFKENPNDTREKMYNAFDKKYQDTAKKILEKWDEFAEIASDYEAFSDEILSEIEDEDESLKFDKDNPGKFIADLDKEEKDLYDLKEKAVTVSVSDKMEEKEYGDQTMREFFSQSSEAFKGNKIRKLYPIVKVLSKGQIAGLDYLSMEELMDAGFNNIAKLDTNSEAYKKLEKNSVYGGVNREIYKKNTVALTNEALRLRTAQEGLSMEDVLYSTFTTTAIITLAIPALATGILFGVYKHLNNKLIHIKNIMDGHIKTAYTNSANVFDKSVITDHSSKEMADMFADDVQNLTTKTGILKTVGIIFAVITFALAVYDIAHFLINATEVYKIDFTPIPKYIVSEEDITRVNSKGEKEFYRNEEAYYRVVECNRSTMKESDDDDEKAYLSKKLEEIGDYADLNGTVGKEWLALYYLKKTNSTPILADSLLVKKGDKAGELPDDYKTGIHMFGDTGAYNLQNDKLLHRSPDKLCVYFKQDESAFAKGATDTKEASASKTGTFVSKGSGVLYGTAGFASGAVITYVILFLARRKKEEKA